MFPAHRDNIANDHSMGRKHERAALLPLTFLAILLVPKEDLFVQWGLASYSISQNHCLNVQNRTVVFSLRPLDVWYFAEWPLSHLKLSSPVLLYTTGVWNLVTLNCCAASGQLNFPLGIIKVSIYLSNGISWEARSTKMVTGFKQFMTVKIVQFIKLLLFFNHCAMVLNSFAVQYHSKLTFEFDQTGRNWLLST